MQTIAPFGITVCGIEELAGHCEAGVSHVLSILDPGWPVPPAFGAYGEHERLELRFYDVIEATPGTDPPTEEHVAALLAFGRDMAAEAGEGVRLLVHCHAGISRSSAAMTLILAQALPRLAASAILREVLRIRAKAWPNLRMIEFGDRMLGRDGALIEASHQVHRLQLDRRPELAELMSQCGRAREVEAAKATASPAW
ncbi:MAG: protein-tyrosine-phosphatase [Acidisphaera sp.]|nr:protein-tyrosine-phosphatase [Acidisphaera sp.]